MFYLLSHTGAQAECLMWVAQAGVSEYFLDALQGMSYQAAVIGYESRM